MTLDAHVVVVIGATGDLYRRKLLPALHALITQSGADVQILGAATTDLDDDGFRAISRDALIAAGIDVTEADQWCTDRLHYHELERGAGYASLAQRIDTIEADAATEGNRIFYLALPPPVFPVAISALGEAGLNTSSGWTRLVIEKPFGRDADSAHQLNEVLHSHFDESQVYRIDHYLGKETVQNLLVFRFANPIFEASWNRDRIDRVEITVAESLDVGGRGSYYDNAGVVRDMIQNHLTQVLSLIAMEAPVSLDADAIRDEKVKILRAIQPVDSSDLALGQYEGYRQEADVPSDSNTPTYAAVRIGIDSWRWQGVPFYLRTGKAMEQRLTQVAVTFKRPPLCLFHGGPDKCIEHSDVLYLTLQPDEGFSLEIEVKEPGSSGRLRTIPLEFSYSQAFGVIPEAYTTLLEDVIEGDQTLFVRADEVEQAWRIHAPIIATDNTPATYSPGSWGPIEARDLLGPEVADWATGPR